MAKQKHIADLPTLSEFDQGSPNLVANDHDNQETYLVDGFDLVSAYLDSGMVVNAEYEKLNEYLSTHGGGGGGEVTLPAMEDALLSATQYSDYNTHRYDFLGYYYNTEDDKGSLVRLSPPGAVANALGDLRYLSGGFGDNCELLVRKGSNYDSFIRADASAFLEAYGGGGEVTLAAINDALSEDLPSTSDYTSVFDVLMYDNYYGMASASLSDALSAMVADVNNHDVTSGCELLGYDPYYENGQLFMVTTSEIVSYTAVCKALYGISTRSLSDIADDHAFLMHSHNEYYDDFVFGDGLSDYLSTYLSNYWDDSIVGHVESYIAEYMSEHPAPGFNIAMETQLDLQSLAMVKILTLISSNT